MIPTSVLICQISQSASSNGKGISFPAKTAFVRMAESEALGLLHCLPEPPFPRRSRVGPAMLESDFAGQAGGTCAD